MKKALTNAPVMAHNSLKAKTVVVDASPWALGAVLLQEQDDCSYRPIAFGSRSLSGTEQKCGQIEGESLAIVFGCEHFHMYLYGRQCEIETDHRPLEHMYRSKASNAGKLTPARIERWRLSFQKYDLQTLQTPKQNGVMRLSICLLLTLSKGNVVARDSQRPYLSASKE